MAEGRDARAGVARRVLVAPAPWKGSWTAAQVAAALADGIRAARPDARVDVQSMADGGEGTGAAVAAALRAVPGRCAARDPLGRPVDVTWWRLPGGGTALVESAAALGLPLLAAAERDPARASSGGLADVARALEAAGVRRVILGVGGTATVDGGAGFLRALGAVFRDGGGRAIEAPNPVLADVAAVDLAGLATAARALRWALWLDVDAPLLGPTGAARAFGPQKGADPALVERLGSGLARLAAALARATGRDPHQGPPGMGAGGGLAAGLWAACGAACESGAEAVIRATGLRARVAAADLVVTGEGRLDATTSQGKAPLAVARLAAALRVPAALVVGAAAPGAEPPGGAHVVAAGRAGALASLEDIRRAGREVGATLG